MRGVFLPLFLILAAAMLFSIPALLNGFPFIFPDSSDYLIFTPRLYRSPFYGLFIFFFHMNRFIWPPVFAQALIVSGLLWLMVDLHAQRNKTLIFSLLALALGLASSLPFFTGFIMADIFTPVMFILMYIIGFHYGKLPRPLLILLLLLDCVATAAHISNLTMGALILPLFLILFAWQGSPGREIIKRGGLLAGPVALTAIAILLFNGLIFGSWSLSPAAPSFLMANLIESGPARTYLKGACPQAGYKICPYVDRLPTKADYLLWWGSGIYDELGGFQGMQKEAAEITAATIQRYPMQVARIMAGNFFAALNAHEPARELTPSADVPPARKLLALKFGPQAESAYLQSAEMRDTIPHSLIRGVDAMVAPGAFFTLFAAGVMAALRGRKQIAALAAVAVCAYLGNALLCAAISGVHDRYQARVTWLLPMAAFFAIYALLETRRRETRET